jgi:hypothetical protein
MTIWSRIFSKSPAGASRPADCQLGCCRCQLLTEGVAGCIRSTSNDLDRIEPPIGMFVRDPVQHHAFQAAIALKELVILVDVLIADGELRRHHVVLHLLPCLRICYCAAAQESGN